MPRHKKEGKKNIRKDISMYTEDINKLWDKMKVIIVDGKEYKTYE